MIILTVWLFVTIILLVRAGYITASSTIPVRTVRKQDMVSVAVFWPIALFIFILKYWFTAPWRLGEFLAKRFHRE